MAGYKYTFQSCSNEDQKITTFSNDEIALSNETLYRITNDDYTNSLCWKWIKTEYIYNDWDADYSETNVIATDSLSCNSCNVIYKARNCTSGNVFYIALFSEGEFKVGEFQYGEFDTYKKEYILPDERVMLPDGECVALEMVPFSEDLFESIKEENKIFISDIKYYAKSCSECNKKGYALEDLNGNIFYVYNSNDLKPYLDKYIKASINGGEEFCAKVIEYKYYSQEHFGIASVEKGCWDTPEGCNPSYTEDDEEFERPNRYVKPVELTKDCGGCKC